MAIEERNRERLKADLYKRENGAEILKTKTKTILDKLTSTNYVRGLESEFIMTTKTEAKSLIIARYGMLECGQNFKGTSSATCTTCDTIDNEDHRLNNCQKWSALNLFNNDEKVDFDQIYSSDIGVIRPILSKIQSVWNTKCANGTMQKV